MLEWCLFDCTVSIESGWIHGGQNAEEGGPLNSPDRLLGEVRTGEMDGVREEE